MSAALRRLPLALCVAGLAGCAIWAPGADPEGKELRANALPVLPALAAYHRDHGRYPLSLHELTPKYILKIPFDPPLLFNRDSGVVEFGYEPTWPQMRVVHCAAHAGDAEWVCR